jgi:hypothetical protein
MDVALSSNTEQTNEIHTYARVRAAGRARGALSGKVRQEESGCRASAAYPRRTPAPLRPWR